VENIININFVQNEKNLELKTKGYISTKFYTENAYDFNSYSKIIKNAESQVRNSEEYKDYILYLKMEIGLTNCAVLGNINHADAEIEMHHYPFTLYDLADIIAINKILNKEKCNSFLIAEELINLHYKNLIGVVPLCKTVHDLVHAGEIFINLKQVFGNVEEFVNIYKNAINFDQKKGLNKIIEMSALNLEIDYKGLLAINLEKSKDYI
jgi:hypothetical protein